MPRFGADNNEQMIFHNDINDSVNALFGNMDNEEHKKDGKQEDGLEK